MSFERNKCLILLVAGVWMLNFIHVATTQDKTCSNYMWRLVERYRNYEGTLEVKVNNTWYNVCAGTVTIDALCSKLNKSRSKTIFIGRNVFKTNLQEEAIYFDKECQPGQKKKPCGTKTETECCQPEAICCNDVPRGDLCSRGWSDIYSEACYSKTDGDRLSYGEARSARLVKGDKYLSWTKSALGSTGLKCDGNYSFNEDFVKNCSTGCLNSYILAKVYVNSKDVCKCLVNDSAPVHQDICYKELEVVNSNTSNVELCIAAEVVNGTTIFKAENCNEFLQPFCAKKTQTDYDTTTPDEVNKPTQQTKHTTGESESVLVPSLTVFGAVAVAAIFICILCKLCDQKSKTETLRPNSMFNKTYDRQMPKTDEEYAIISEIELDSGATVYKPPLPEREISNPVGNIYHRINYRNDSDSGAIVTLDDYSTPSDVIKDKVEDDPSTDYSTTYDDPIRHNAENINEIKRISETQEICDKQLLEISQDVIVSKSRNQRDGNANVHNYKHKTDTANVTDIVEEAIIDTKDTDKRCDSDKPEFVKICDTSGSVLKSSALDKTSTTKVNVSLEYFTPPGVEEASDVDTDSGPNYEDTNIIDGNFPARPKKHLIGQHVCLHCLKPEHLQELGIKIISERRVEHLEKRLSEPPRKTCADAPCRQLRRCNTDVVNNSDDETDLISFTEELETAEGTKKCVECNTVYDKLGHIKAKASDVHR